MTDHSASRFYARACPPRVRESRSIVYSASYEALADLVKFLMEDCCLGHPVVRAPLVKADPCCTSQASAQGGNA